MPSTILNVSRIINIVFLVLYLSACSPQNTKEVSTKEVTLESSGSYTDSSGLTWTRCPLGMSWSQSQCEGTATLYTFDEAKNVAQQLNARLPSFSEYRNLYKQDMSSIMPINCKGVEVEDTVRTTNLITGVSTTEIEKDIVGEKQCHYRSKSNGIVDVFKIYNNYKPYLAYRNQPSDKNRYSAVMLVH
jgi:hypothetical protein